MKDATRSYTLPTESTPTLDLAHHLNDIRDVRTFLESRGIETTNTRIERYGQYLERSLQDGTQWVAGEEVFKNSAGEPFRTPIDWFLYVLREVHELMWILKGLKRHVPAGADEKLRLIVGGRDFAALDQDSRSRDAQFELRIASYFCQSGCDVDMSTDTDVVARTSRHAFFVECKRVASRSKLGTRLSEARAQLTHRMPRKGRMRRLLGCIAVDVTKVAFTHNGLTFGVTAEHTRDVIREKLLEISAEADHQMSFDSCKKLLCYWLQIHIPTLIMHPSLGAVATRLSSYHVPRPSLGRKDAKTLTAFYDMFESVSQPDYRTSPGQPLTPRNTVSFPAGTLFGVEGDRVLKLLAQETTSEDEQAEVVGTLTIEGTEHKFTFFEVTLLPREHIDEWKRKMSTDSAKGSVMLLAGLYLRRFPYEETQQAGELDAPAAPTLAPSDSEE